MLENLHMVLFDFCLLESMQDVGGWYFTHVFQTQIYVVLYPKLLVVQRNLIYFQI